MSTVFDAPQSIGDDILPTEEMEVEEPVAEEVSGDPVPAPEVQSEPITKEVTPEPEASERTESDDLLDQIWNAEQDVRKKEARIDLLKEEMKEAKSQREQAVIRLRELCSERDSIGSYAGSSSVSPAAKSSQVVSEETSVQEDEPDTSWRDTPLTEVLKTPIKGLGPKKTEAILDICPTIGAFEDLRSKVGVEVDAFHKLLPKSIGPDTASELEERVIDWVVNHVKQPSIETDKEKILKRSQLINDGSDGSLDAKHPEGRKFYESGWEAFGKDWPLEDCPHVPGPEQDDWIRGWLGHQAMSKWESNKSSDEASDQNTVSLDDL